jgi:hypothetical protein
MARNTQITVSNSMIGRCDVHHSLHNQTPCETTCNIWAHTLAIMHHASHSAWRYLWHIVFWRAHRQFVHVNFATSHVNFCHLLANGAWICGHEICSCNCVIGRRWLASSLSCNCIRLFLYFESKFFVLNFFIYFQICF